MKQRIIYTLAILFATTQTYAQRTIKYEYDDMNRLTKVTYANGSTVSFNYDELGNRLCKSVLGILKGDVTHSGKVDVQDATIAVNHILGTASSEAYDYTLLDMNNDNVVDVFDVTAIINVILSGNGNTAGARSLARGDENMESVRLATDEDDLLFGIDRADRFTSFQFDVEVPDGAKLEGVEWGSKTGHRLQFAKNGEHRYTVVALSLASKLLPTSDGTLLKLRLSDTVEGEVTIGNVLFVTPEGRAARFNGGTMSMATGIVSATLNDKGDEWYDLDGRKMSGQPTRKGVYIFNNKKVVIK
ncbi:MAG: hypothetical protein K6G32_10210 [Prevotella sp.]|nr:hypothetical protein [Prevotella sp.]